MKKKKKPCEGGVGNSEVLAGVVASFCNFTALVCADGLQTMGSCRGV